MQPHINTCCDSLSPRAHSPTLPLSPHNASTPPPPSGSKASVGSNAFSILMSSHKENNAWKEAEAVEDRSFRATKANGGRRKAPFYKVLQGMPIAVDAFRYGEIPGVTSYFLTYASIHVSLCPNYPKHGCPGTRIQTTTLIYRHHGRLVQSTARVSIDYRLDDLSPNSSVQRVLQIWLLTCYRSTLNGFTLSLWTYPPWFPDQAA